MKYLKLFEGFENNFRIEVDGFELEVETPIKKNKKLTLTENEWNQICLIMDTHGFFSDINKNVFPKSIKQPYEIVYSKHENDCYYVQHSYHLDKKVYKCNGFQGLINCINFLGRESGILVGCRKLDKY